MNVLPPGSTTKGEAALALMFHLKQEGPFFVGDDETDEDVFGLREGLIMGVPSVASLSHEPDII